MTKLFIQLEQLNKANLATNEVCVENEPKPWFACP